jgi:hypothetical protein
VSGHAPDDGAGFTLRRRVLDYSFRLAGEGDEFSSLCEAIYPNSGCRRGAPDDARGGTLYRLSRDSRGLVSADAYRRRASGRGPLRRATLKRARSVKSLLGPLEWWITYDILYSHPQHIHLHGAGFRHEDAAVLLPGAHGAGKTSLALEALRRGYRVYGDEIQVIDARRLVALPYPRCFVVKEPGMRLFPGLRGVCRTRGPRKHGRVQDVYYVNPREIREDYRAAPARCRFLIFPHYSPGAGASLRPLDDLDVMGRLLASLFTFYLNREACVAAVAGLARRSQAFELRFGDLERGFDAIERLVAPGGAR